MIGKKYVFVLGAGASMPFDFPSGKRLVEDVSFVLSRVEFSIATAMDYDAFRNHNRNCNLIRLLCQDGISIDHIETFRHSLINSQLNSVDAFLEHRPEFNSIGKKAIGYCLLSYEELSKKPLRNGDWYRYLWNYMKSS